MVRVWQRPETEDKVPANAPLIEYHLKSSPMSLSTNFHSIENASTQAPRISGSEQPLAGLTEQDDSTLQASTTSSALLEAVDKLKFFLATAPGSFDPSPINSHDVSVLEDRCFNRFPLPTGEQISCILWNGLYHITGTDIVRALNFRFLAFGRPVKNVKKFEEGIFSDLRNLKAGTDATLEEPKVGPADFGQKGKSWLIWGRATFSSCFSSTIASARRKNKRCSIGFQYHMTGFF